MEMIKDASLDELMQEVREDLVDATEEEKQYLAQFGDKYVRQLAYELLYKKKGEAALINAIRKGEREQNLSETCVGKKFVDLQWAEMRENIAAMVAQGHREKAGNNKWLPVMQMLVKELYAGCDEELTDMLTLVVLTELVNRCLSADALNTESLVIPNREEYMRKNIVRILEKEFEIRHCVQSFKDEKKGKAFESRLKEGIKKRHKESYKINYANRVMSYQDYTPLAINKEGLERLVAYLFNAVLGDGSGYFRMETVSVYYKGVYKDVKKIVANDVLVKLEDPLIAAFQERSNKLGPSIIIPKAWTNPLENSAYYGVLSQFSPFIRQDVSNKTKLGSNQRRRLHDADLSSLMKAVNAIQSTPFRINKRVLAVWEHTVNAGKGQFAGVPLLDINSSDKKPVELSDSEKEDEEAIAKYKKEMAGWYSTTSVSLRSKKDKFINSVYAAAQLFKDEEEVYFGYNLDYRGRIYPIPTDLHPQGDDNMKGILEFANPTPCKDADDWKWLAIAGATHCAYEGLDKKTFDERIKWVLDNTENILASAKDPINNDWWYHVSEAEHPVCFLAFCFEWSDLQEYLASNETCIGFECRIPIPFDGSCSGIQHYSAILRDEIGGKAVNLTNTGKVEDIYMEVANEVDVILKEDAATGSMKSANASGKVTPGTKVLANQWLLFINKRMEGATSVPRKLVKRSVMTLSYGSGSFGFKENLLEDFIRPAVIEHSDASFKIGEVDTSFYAAVYMAKLISDAVETKVVAAVRGMKFLQKIAGLVARNGEAVAWTTPMGLPIQQHHIKESMRNVDVTIQGSNRKIAVPTGEIKLDVHRQKNSVAPNFIHSLDACHLQMVVYASYEEGIRNFQMIHDSFATDLANSGRFFKIIREQFVRLYTENDVMADFLDNASTLFDEKDLDKLPALPKKYKLNLNEVLVSDYAFA